MVMETRETETNDILMIDEKLSSLTKGQDNIPTKCHSFLLNVSNVSRDEERERERGREREREKERERERERECCCQWL